MSNVNLAELQTLLEGVSLPASKQDLVAYGRSEGASAGELAALERLADGSYPALDDVAEALRPVQPASPAELPGVPEAESSSPPGAESYTARD